MQVNVCMQIHTLNRYRYYMHSVSKTCVYHMMQANACCTFNLISTYMTSLVATTMSVVFSHAKTHYSDNLTNASFQYFHAEQA